ncbi:hypothetical protein IU459_16140 [Nocardia amamiensis]|uniref:DUF222 domain-containing protein n=1 Tax=Nocardia amamiensis TaxID=404578 RepID=A0ABS0CSD1_9NOCA|nr:hypothetical protein [Nocardia amamiensis]MBF6299060.1 hypothetical protein [Nocardia amamiensis]
MCALSLVTRDHQRLYRELESLRKRSIPLAFGHHEGTGPIKIEILTRIVQALHPGTDGNEVQLIQATTATVAAAIAQLPNERLPKTDRSSPVTYRQAASLMFQVPPLPLELLAQIEHQYETPKHMYAKIARYVQELAAIPDTDKAIQEVNSRIRSELAATLLREEKSMAAQAHDLGAGKETDETAAARDAVQEETASEPEASHATSPQPTAAPTAGLPGMTVTVTSSENVVVGPYASQTNHFHK